MSDIIKFPPERRRRQAGPTERVLGWIERRIRDDRLSPGDSLPGEIEIAAATKTGRSSVREALAAMRALGIIRSRRKGGITIIRDPVLLEIRHYFSERYDSSDMAAEAMEFRAAMEWGFGRLALARVGGSTIRSLRKIVRDAVRQARTQEDLMRFEIRFHTALTAGCGNRLAALLAHLYAPVFRGMERDDRPLTPAERTQWEDHLTLVEALEKQDHREFLRLLKVHTHSWMRFKRN
jgi:GntR family transcriptional repressor for pyruvate dehydrogenase complex